MTTLIMQAAPFVEFVAPKIRSFYKRFLRTLDAIAEAKLRNAVPARQLRKARRQIEHQHRIVSHRRPGGIALLDWDDFGSRI